MSARLRPAARAAVVALDAFGAVTPRQAHQLLGLWARRDELDAADVASVLSYYEPTPAAEDDGSRYSRDRDEPTGEPVPDHVDGYSLGTRGGAQ